MLETPLIFDLKIIHCANHNATTLCFFALFSTTLKKGSDIDRSGVTSVRKSFADFCIVKKNGSWSGEWIVVCF